MDTLAENVTALAEFMNTRNGAKPAAVGFCCPISAPSAMDMAVKAGELDVGLVDLQTRASTLTTLMTTLGTTLSNMIDDKETDAIAQGACIAIGKQLSQGAGWYFAPPRECTASSRPCSQVCTDAQGSNNDPQTASATWSGFESLHVYNRGKDKSDLYGHKTYRYRSVSGQNYCGPNFCCCHAA
eukprot:NODE_6373_length_642_cov_41.646602_g6350_i0.p1 GENE.NODE_6373_length_642_cov_41.646602_g6350_i0~~NODE_6373_length_642_cov_41.646602_g6350_i0.p1  ORF type:complete len:198 (-),score=51.41 NODE_6373_length_642_cov_41.646602_g6350_i0:49-600(-)